MINKKSNHTKFKRAALSFVSVIAMSTAVTVGPAIAQEAQASELKIEAQPLSDAINAIADQSGAQIVLHSDDANGVTTPALDGVYTAEQALDIILVGTGLEYQRVNDRTIAVGAPARFASSQGASLGGETPRPFQVAQVDQEATVQLVTENNDVNDEEARQDVIIVTGTNIRGVRETPSPVLRLDRSDIEDRGYVSLPDLLDDIPSNLADITQTSLFSAVTDAGTANSEVQAVGINLRGLGPEATLTLVNGVRRPSVADTRIVDISSIPLVAIEGIDITTGGSSSIYGADAVAGVVNLRTRRSFDGAETSAQVSLRDGDTGDSYSLSQIIGHQAERGGFAVAYEYQSVDALDATAAGVTGTSRFGDDAVPGQYQISPDNEQHSVFGAGEYQLTEGLGVFGDVLFSNRETDQITNTTGTFFNLNSSTEIESEQFSVFGNYELLVWLAQQRALTRFEMNFQVDFRASIVSSGPRNRRSRR